MRLCLPGIALTLSLAVASLAAEPRVVDVIDVAPVWAGHPVGFVLLTRQDRQFVGFYDAERRLTIGVRALDSDRWSFKVLPTSVGWDSHNDIELALDDEGYLHIAANMHSCPLIYFRSGKPLDIDSIERVASMVGSDEARCTYPSFLRGPANEFLFTYRSGSSGNGNQIYNRYDHASRTWGRLLDQPLTDGQGLMNAYFRGPVRGPDGYFHLCWTWRDTGDCATNHDLSYARSRDLRQWETAAGKPLKLPLRLGDAEVVDPVPVHGGMINNNTIVGFDAQRRVIISYHKFDTAGATQLYNARFENGAWKIYQTSDWTYRWDFTGGGTIPFEIRVSGVTVGRDGKLTQAFTHSKHGSGVWTLDETTLKPISVGPRPAGHPTALDACESDFPGMQVNWRTGKGSGPDPKTRYELRWETLGINRDQARPKPWPPPSPLRVYAFSDSPE